MHVSRRYAFYSTRTGIAVRTPPRTVGSSASPAGNKHFSPALTSGREEDYF